MSGEWQFSDTNFGGSDYPTEHERETRRRINNMGHGRLPRDNGSCDCNVVQTCDKCRNPRGKEVSPNMTKAKVLKKTGKKAVKAVKKSTKR